MADNNSLLLYNKLKTLGTCKGCAFRFVDNAIITSPLEDFLVSKGYEQTKESNEPNICISCVGLLQNSCLEDTSRKIQNKLDEFQFDHNSYMLGVTLPSCFYIRECSLKLYLKNEYPEIYKAKRIPSNSLKDVWRDLMSIAIRANTNKYLDSRSKIVVLVNIKYKNEDEECSHIKPLLELPKFGKNRVSNRCTQDVLETLLDKADFERFLPCPPTVSDIPAECDAVTVQRDSIFCAGRYNKWTRLLSQTPWIVDGKRMMEDSVEELISQHLMKEFKTNESRFSSSGREDVDVRTLGNGRPFVLELINARVSRISFEDFRRIEKDINDTGRGLISVKDLQVVDRNDLKYIKEGEEEKTKEYCALCVVFGTFPADIYEKSLAPLTIEQKTPVRVLHRRSSAKRKKQIFDLKIVPADVKSTDGKTFVKVYLTTEAGAYIKEFIHGDLGRTVPSLCDLLGGVNIDVIALDVMNVNLDWPPSITC